MIEIQEEFNKLERASLVAVKLPENSLIIVEENLSELELLSQTAGAEVIAKFIQHLEKPNPATYIGKGKIEEIASFIQDNDIDIIIFDDELSPTQTRNLQNAFNKKVIDRTSLILSIFAKHARTKEAKLQVELAQSQYMLSRLTKLWSHLSKQYGGIGTKGPGETQLETDRRILKDRIAILKKKIDQIETQHDIKTANRENIFKCALVGYTNAGKSTLMNLLTDANVLVENKLFATLDSTTRLCYYNNKKFLLSDTVGFIQKLPHNLIASFRSTLKEVTSADLIIIVVDISNKAFKDHLNVVLDTLNELKCTNKEKILVFNKFDALQNKSIIKDIKIEFPNAVIISALQKININELLTKIEYHITNSVETYKIELNQAQTNLITEIYKHTDVVEINYKDDENIEVSFRCRPYIYKNILAKL
ncbi:MAG TPA: GTPase HflX [Ignavibacteriales bacterium]|nr:GTPase HflX [Ignavibacteriales bacterium]